VIHYFEKHLFVDPQIEEPPSRNLGMIITIPCFNEPDLLSTLESLEECDSTNCDLEVIVNVNSSSAASEYILKQNQKTIDDFLEWKKGRIGSSINYHLIQCPKLPKKHAGVGLARKIVMDEASWRFSLIENPKGVIICLDADCIVDKNYLTEIEKHFQLNPKATGCSIYFEHPIEGNQYDEKGYDSIINYELFLRYYVLGLKYSGFPYPYHTIGSSMAVHSDVYMKQGGMNRRQAGEDFYFLHKVLPLGNFSELNSTRVIPSPRLSDRVPFGTGADMTKQMMNGSNMYAVYNPQSFYDLKYFFQNVPLFYTKSWNDVSKNIPSSITNYLIQENFEVKLAELKEHTASQAAFVKRFFKWFDGFKVLKFVHFARDNSYPQMEVAEAVVDLLAKVSYSMPAASKKDLLIQLREMQRGQVSIRKETIDLSLLPD